MKTIVAALGGNAILQKGQRGTAKEQTDNIRIASLELAQLVISGHTLVLTHGNGPQVGNILLQNEEASKAGIPPMPLDICGAQSQGFIGYALQNALGNELRTAGLVPDVVTLVTQVVVDKEDTAFRNPTKPIGPFYEKERACELAHLRGYVMREDAGRGYRRVVASPDPVEIVEMPLIRSLVSLGKTVIASGGGGIPVVRDDDGSLHGVEAVIDKDLAAERIASRLGADVLLILTDVDKVALDYRRRTERFVDRATAAQFEAWYEQGHFAQGSMGPKITAALRFLAQGGERAIITRLENARKALEGAGTHITNN